MKDRFADVLRQFRTVVASSLFLLVFAVGCNYFGGGGVTGSPLAVLSAADLATYKSMVSDAVGGCACVNNCSYINQTAGQPRDCNEIQNSDGTTGKVVSLTDPTDGISKRCRISCFCECQPDPEITCVVVDSLVGWPRPVDANVIWGQE